MPVVKQLKQTLDLADPEKGEEGLGYFGSKVPAVFVGEKGRSNRQLWQSIKNSLGHELFGGALSPGELKRLEAEMDGAGTLDEMKNTARRWVSVVEAKRSNINAAVRPSARAKYERSGGPVTEIKEPVKVKPIGGK
jgi:hypothetical protein